ncbi:hypothetical protein G8767_31690 [Rhodococcus sp. IC4_135]|uniref:hypothetical protein n=1 Tax=Rhodococcus sp. IC4_135 TaxID=2715537 RepID=UPI0014248BF6|nr:hypothetical protein [Rhodococcus sp. IC4_135]
MTFFPDNTANVVLAGPGRAENLPDRAWHLSEHHLVGRQGCGVVLATGWADYQEPKGIHQWFKSARGDGAVWLGSVIEPREFFLPVYVHKTQGRPFHSVNDGFWSDIDYHFESRLFVNTREGTRYLDVRLADQPRITDVFDPAFDEFVPYLVPVIAGRPWWMGLEAVCEWKNGQSTERLKLKNNGDRKGHPIWTVQGPGVFQIPDGDKVVTTPNLEVGEVARIHTDRSTPRPMRSNKRPFLYRDFGGQKFRGFIPGRAEMSMKKLAVIGGNAQSSAVATLTPMSRRPR